MMRSRLVAKAPMMRRAMAPAFWSARWRSSQSLSFTKTMPLFWAVPEKPMPTIIMQASTESFSCSET